MSILSRSILRNLFKNGNLLTEDNFSDLFDSFCHKTEDNVVTNQGQWITSDTLDIFYEKLKPFSPEVSYFNVAGTLDSNLFMPLDGSVKSEDPNYDPLSWALNLTESTEDRDENLNKSIDSLSDIIAMIQVAHGEYSELSAILERIIVIATEISTDGSFTSSQTDELVGLFDELLRCSAACNYNGEKVIDTNYNHIVKIFYDDKDMFTIKVPMSQRVSGSSDASKLREYISDMQTMTDVLITLSSSVDITAKADEIITCATNANNMVIDGNTLLYDFEGFFRDFKDCVLKIRAVVLNHSIGFDASYYKERRAVLENKCSEVLSANSVQKNVLYSILRAIFQNWCYGFRDGGMLLTIPYKYYTISFLNQTPQQSLNAMNLLG